MAKARSKKLNATAPRLRPAPDPAPAVHPARPPLPGPRPIPSVLRQLLTRLAPGDKIRVDLAKLPSGEVIVTDAQPPEPRNKEEAIARNPKYAGLIGVEITVSEAEKKYGVKNPTIHRWIKLEYIRVIDKASYPMTIDEADMAYCADVYKSRKEQGLRGSGAPLLDEDGLPYKWKHKKLSEYRRRKRQQK